MFRILHKTFETGIVTIPYPERPTTPSASFRGRPAFDLEKWRDARPAAEVCPTEAITVQDNGEARQVAIDYGRCVFCGLCAAVSEGAVTMTSEYELAVRRRGDLVLTAGYALQPDGTHKKLVSVTEPAA